MGLKILVILILSASWRIGIYDFVLVIYFIRCIRVSIRLIRVYFMTSSASTQIENLGNLLRGTRLSLGYQLAEVAKTIKISEEYLNALEMGDYYKIPSPTYARGFLERYAEFLNLDSPELLGLYRRESLFSEVKQQVISQQSEGQKKLPIFANHKIKSSTLLRPANTLHLLKPKKIKNNNLQKTAGIILSIGLVIYLAAVITQPFFPPQIKIFSPDGGLITDQKNITIKGWTDKGAVVRINNQAIIKDGNNLFSEDVNLLPGLNTIKISAKKINSSESVVWRQIFVK